MQETIKEVMRHHLSDAQLLITRGHTKDALYRIEFVKLLAQNYKNLETRISKKDLNLLWDALIKSIQSNQH